MKIENCWSKNGKLATGGIQLADTLQEVSLQTPELTPQYFTVQFGVHPPGTVANPPAAPKLPIYRAVAEVRWSVAGSSISRFLDVINGAVLSGLADHVSVVVRDATNPALSIGLVYSIDVNVASGVRPSTNQPARLQPDISGGTVHGGSTALAPLGVATAKIPPGVISVYATVVDSTLIPLAAGSARIIFRVDGTAEQVGYVELNGQGAWVPVPPMANALLIQSSNAAQTIIVTLTYGVEG